MDDKVISWEPYTWMQSAQYINGVKANLREMFFYLHTDSGLYRCDIRDIPEDTSQGVSAGIYSISIFPALFPDQTPDLDETYDGYCTWSRENMGISIAYTTRKPNQLKPTPLNLAKGPLPVRHVPICAVWAVCTVLAPLLFLFLDQPL